MSQGFYDDAIGEFRDFVKNYTDPVRFPAAQFYIGEALLIQRKFDQALEQFDIVLEKYPNSDRKCLALYRKGRALVELKQNSSSHSRNAGRHQRLCRNAGGYQCDCRSEESVHTATGAIGLETRYGKVDQQSDSGGTAWPGP